MRLGTKVGNDFWISMGPVGWCIYFFIWRPLWLVICIVIWILILLYKGIAWCGKSLWKLAYGKR
jgi:hypothetical protein